MARRNRSADIHARGRFLGLGPLVAHSDAVGRIRERDGAFYRGAELGYVDRRHRIRRKGGLLQRVEVVGHIRGNSAYGRLAMLIGGPRWGYVDQYGNVWQQGSDQRPSRIIGKAKGADPEAALAYFVLKFQDLLDHVSALEEKVKHSGDRYTFLPRVRAMLKALPDIDALGDVDAAADRLSTLEAKCVTELNEQLLDARRRLWFWKRSPTRATLEDLRSTWDLSAAERREQFEAVLLKARDAIEAVVDGRLPSLSTLDVAAFGHAEPAYEIHFDEPPLVEPASRGALARTRSSVERLRNELDRIRQEPGYRLDDFWDQAGKLIGAVLDPRQALLPAPRHSEVELGVPEGADLRWQQILADPRELGQSLRRATEPRLALLRERLRRLGQRRWRL